MPRPAWSAAGWQDDPALVRAGGAARCGARRRRREPRSSILRGGRSGGPPRRREGRGVRASPSHGASLRCESAWPSGANEDSLWPRTSHLFAALSPAPAIARASLAVGRTLAPRASAPTTPASHLLISSLAGLWRWRSAPTRSSRHRVTLESPERSYAWPFASQWGPDLGTFLGCTFSHTMYGAEVGKDTRLRAWGTDLAGLDLP